VGQRKRFLPPASLELKCVFHPRDQISTSVGYRTSVSIAEPFHKATLSCWSFRLLPFLIRSELATVTRREWKLIAYSLGYLEEQS